MPKIIPHYYPRKQIRSRQKQSSGPTNVKSPVQLEKKTEQQRFRRRVERILSIIKTDRQRLSNDDLIWWNSAMSCVADIHNRRLIKRFFPLIPNVVVGCFHYSLSERFSMLEDRLISFVHEKNHRLHACRFDSHLWGKNLGCTVVNGGRYGNSIHIPGGFSQHKEIKPLIEEFKTLFSAIIRSSFGHQKWFQVYEQNLKKW